MIKPDKPQNEEARLAALRSYEILDTEAEAAFDDVVTIAATLCDVPMASISLIDAERQWFKARKGLDESQTTRESSFCAHAILDPAHVLQVPDASLDERFHDNPLVTRAGGLRFYAGAPLLSRDGHALGTLCVMDTVAGALDDEQLAALQALSRQVSYLLELRRVSKDLNLQLQDRVWYEQQLNDYHDHLENQNADLAEQTRTDPLTGLPNRRAFAVALEAATVRAVEQRQPLAVGVMDIDHFKMINDLHGHAQGDLVLVELAKLLRSQFSGSGIAARYGGEEFVMLFPGASLDQARLQCEFIRQSVAVMPLGLPVSVSIGLTQLADGGDTAEALFKRADDALYAAKRGGRDQVMVAALQ